MSAPYPKTSALNTVIIVLVHTGVTVSFCPQDTTNNNIFSEAMTFGNLLVDISVLACSVGKFV